MQQVQKLAPLHIAVRLLPQAIAGKNRVFGFGWWLT